MRIGVVLPWPSPKLSPNARVHWAELAKAKAAYRRACFVLCREAGFEKEVFHAAQDLRLSLSFVPPTRAGRDLDNCLASMKAGIDGLADALGVDDRRFVIELRLEKGQLGGFVDVTVEAV